MIWLGNGNWSSYTPPKIDYPIKECKSKSQCKSSEICHDTLTESYCVPKKKCTRQKDCPDVGSLVSGLISARCKSGKCAYRPVVTIA